MILKSFSRSGTTHNEDVFEITPTYGFVLDGATGLLKEKVTNMESDAQWFVNEWKTFLNKNITNTKPLHEILKQGVELIESNYLNIEGAKEVKSKPSACIAMYRVINKELEYFLLGDCGLIISLESGEVIHLQPQQVAKFDQMNIDRMVKLAKEKNIDVISARPLINEYLVETRLTQNTKDGYYILSNSYEAIDNGLYGKIDFTKVTQIIILSDGFSQIFDTFEIMKVDKFAEIIESGCSLGELYNTLWNLQEKDKSCNKYPRVKVRDDATIIVYGK